MNEETLVKTLPLPYGQRWLWMPEANMVILSPELDCTGRETAISELQDYWRRSCLRVVGGDAVPVHASPPPTQPMSKAQIRAVVEAL